MLSFFFPGIGTSIALASGIPVIPIAQRLIQFFGSLNILYAACTVTGIRLVLYALIT
jgi:hypothetical protein